jgi:hypothetical protein
MVLKPYFKSSEATDVEVAIGNRLSE